MCIKVYILEWKWVIESIFDIKFYNKMLFLRKLQKFPLLVKNFCDIDVKR